jgi:hypothetical protein
MKAVGARFVQIAALHLTVVGVVTVLAAAVGTALGLAAGRAWVDTSAQLLNLEIGTYSVPAWALVSNLVIGVLVPLAAAAVPVFGACRRTVRDAMSDAGIHAETSRPDGFERALAKLHVAGSPATLGLRNAFRRRGRAAVDGSHWYRIDRHVVCRRDSRLDCCRALSVSPRGALYRQRNAGGLLMCAKAGGGQCQLYAILNFSLANSSAPSTCGVTMSAPLSARKNGVRL